MAHDAEPFSPVDRELVRMLRSLDLTELQPGVRERCWDEFRELAGLPEAPLPSSAQSSAELPQPSAELDAPAQIDRRRSSNPAKVPAKFKLRAWPA